MENLSPPSWVPTCLFALLAVYFLQKAVRRNAPQTWGWGRGGGEVPLSRASYAVIGVSFLDIGAMLAYDGQPPIALMIVLLLGFIAMLVMGTRDAIVWRRQHSEAGKSRKPWWKIW